MSASQFFGLVLCNLIWAFNPVAGKILLGCFSPTVTAWLRHSSAALGFLGFVFLSRLLPPGKRFSRLRTDHLLAIPRSGAQGRRDWKLIVSGAFLTFCFSPLIQTLGLNASRASDNSLIVAMEPLVTVALASLFLGEKLSRSLMSCFAVALAGFVLLSGAGFFGVMGGVKTEGHFVGDLLLLISLLGEGSYSSLGRKLIARYSPVEVFGSVLVVGVGFLSLSLILFKGSDALRELADPARWTHETILALLWLGPLGTALTYLYWMIVLQDVPVAAMALTLFVQPVCGALFGVLVLRERMGGSQILGAGLILLAVLGQWWIQRAASKPLANMAQ